MPSLSDGGGGRGARRGAVVFAKVEDFSDIIMRVRKPGARANRGDGGGMACSPANFS